MELSTAHPKEQGLKQDIKGGVGAKEINFQWHIQKNKD